MKAVHVLLLLIATSVAFCASGEDYLLYWQVLDTATVEGTLIGDYVSAYAQANNNFDWGYGDSGRIAGARAVYFDADGAGPSLMNLYTPDPWAETSDTAMYIDNEDTLKIVGGRAYSHFTASNPTELSFAIELGNWENGEWVTLAVSDRVNYGDLSVMTQDGVHIVSMPDLASYGVSDFRPWTPQAYSVPEPSSGLLLLVGAGLLALRRRRG